MLKSHLDGAFPVTWKAETRYCPRDFGGEDFDEIEYEPFCPSCDRKLERNKPNFCSKCGIKLWWNCEEPELLEEDE